MCFLAFFGAKMTKIDNLDLKLIVSNDYQQFRGYFEDTHAINVIQNSVSRVTSRHMTYQYMRESNTHATNVIQNSVSRGSL